MKKSREDRSKDKLKQQWKAWDTKYNAKIKLTSDEASTVIRLHYHKSKQQQAKRKEAKSIATSILNDLLIMHLIWK